jgi:hypothetical protein
MDLLLRFSQVFSDGRAGEPRRSPWASCLWRHRPATTKVRLSLLVVRGNHNNSSTKIPSSHDTVIGTNNQYLREHL